MARARGKGGKYEEERHGSLARFDEIAGAVAAAEREKKEIAVGEEIMELARRAMTFSPASVNRRVGVSLTLSLRAVDGLDRLAILRGMKRGQLADEIILAAVKAADKVFLATTEAGLGLERKGKVRGEDSD